LTQATGVHIEVESSQTVVLALTTPFFWSESSEETGKSRTLGELVGEKADLLDSLVATLVEFVHMRVFSLNDRSIKIMNLKYLINKINISMI
jgi:hypothetical protein